MSSTEKGKWKRPDAVPFPSIWRRCNGKKKMADGKIPKFIIQDITEDMSQDVIQHMTTEFLRDETICKSAGLVRDPVSVKEFQEFWWELLKNRIAIVALLDEEPGVKPRKIAGANMLDICYKGEKDLGPFKGVPMNTVLDLVKICTHLDDVFERYGVTEYMTAYGLSVAPEFRGQGLGLELLRARVDVGKAVGLRATATVFSAIESQRLATAAGYDILGQVRYLDYKVDGKVVFPDTNTEFCQLMATRLY